MTLPALAISGDACWQPEPGSAYRAIAFDAFTVFDPRLLPLGAALYPDHADKLVKSWRTRQFESTWLRTMTNIYVDFRRVTEESLVYAAQVSGVELTADRRDQLIACFYALPAWPDAKAVLQQLRRSGQRPSTPRNSCRRPEVSASATSRQFSIDACAIPAAQMCLRNRRRSMPDGSEPHTIAPTRTGSG